MHLTQIQERRQQIATVAEGRTVACGRRSTAGVVSQRACVFCGARVVLYPIADALHLIHGPIGCAAYTWDIRGSLSSHRELHRLSFSTDLREDDVIHGGERQLEASLLELIDRHRPAAAFVYATCLVGVIGDDIEAVCRKVATRCGIPVVAVNAPGFAGTKKDGYKAACEALGQIIGQGDPSGISPLSINILGEFNLAGETWMLRDYYQRLGIETVATVTGDGCIADIARCHGARLNVVQCSGSMIHLARLMEQRYGIPFLRVSYFGIEDTAQALYDVARHFGDPALMTRAQDLVRSEVETISPTLKRLRRDLQGRSAAVYTGGAFKAISLVRALRSLGMRTVMAGSQTGNDDDYRSLASICDPDTVIVDDTNTLEIAAFLEQHPTDLFIGGVKERPIAYKLGVAFCDHNHERKHALAGFTGMVNFAEEIHRSVLSPVWRFRQRHQGDPVAQDPDTLRYRPPPSPLAAGGRLRRTAVRRRSQGSVSTTNACTMCTPLGACLAFKGIAGAVPFLHGSQGCSTYIRRYLIGHFREPMDIGCSNFSEDTVIFGGQEAFITGLRNLSRQYQPEVIGIATTCLAETIGEDLERLISTARTDLGETAPALIPVSTASYSGSYRDGYHRSIRATVAALADPDRAPAAPQINVLPGMVSPADLRYLQRLLAAFGYGAGVLPDYSDSLDGPTWNRYQRLPAGGTPLDTIRSTARAQASIGLALCLADNDDAGLLLQDRFQVPYYRLPAPVGIAASDRLVGLLSTLSGRPWPQDLVAERGRLIDAAIDAHKFCFGKRVAVYGDEDLVLAVARFLLELGMIPAVLVTGAGSGTLGRALAPDLDQDSVIVEDGDCAELAELVDSHDIDLLIGHSKGYPIAQRAQRPLIRLGLPISDRVGAARLASFGHHGSHDLLDRIINALIASAQDASPVGYMTY